MYSSDELFQRSPEGYFDDYWINKYENNTRVSIETIHHGSTNIILPVTREMFPFDDVIMKIIVRPPRVCID